MPYSSIDYRHIVDPETRALFHRASDVLGDVYTMLSSRPLHRTKGGGCNLAATLVLLCIVDAIATHHYPKLPAGKRGDQRIRFTTLIRDKLPGWGAAARWTPLNVAAELLYDEFRNPLTHALGVDAPSGNRPAGYVEPTAGPWGAIPRKRIGAIDARRGWPEAWPIVGPYTDKSGTRHKLTVAGLYWAVKRMVADLAAMA